LVYCFFIESSLLVLVLFYHELSTFNLSTSYTTITYWSIEEQKFVSTYEEIMFINNREHLLVPKNFVSKFPVYNSSSLFNNIIIDDYKQMLFDREMSITTNKSKFYRKINRDEVVARINIEFNRNDDSLKEFILRYVINKPELYEKYRIFVKNKLSYPIDPTKMITDIDLSIISNLLIENLQSILPGRDDAYEYPKICAHILTLLFYPNLINVQPEVKAYRGKKRIDLLMDNISKVGLFDSILNIDKIVSSYIFFECKNYTSDLNNTEIDQMLGRFSNRTSKVGILLCREIKNRDLFEERLSDVWKNSSNLILYLTDRDLINSLNTLSTTGKTNIEDILITYKRRIMMG